MVEHPKSKSTQPRFATRCLTLYTETYSKTDTEYAKNPNQRCPPETGQVERDARPDRVGDLQPPEEAEGGGRGRQVIATADFVLLDDADFLVDVAAGGGKDSYGAALLL